MQPTPERTSREAPVRKLAPEKGGPAAALRHAAFRRVWLASILSNFGLLINGVGAAWAMTELSGKPEDVALVQTALMLPFMLFALPAGAISDTYDKRKVGLITLVFAFGTSVLLTGVAAVGGLTPTLLLFLCFLNGVGNATFGPAWQSSVSEQVPRADLPPAVALNSISYNIARSFGPAVGGVIVAAAGAVAAFGVTALCYLPIMLAFLLWRRKPETPRLPPERVGAAVMSGLRYVLHSPPARAVIIRSILIGLTGASISSLMPLLARDVMGGAAVTYGILLGSFGIGAVLGAFIMPWLRRFPPELHVGGSTALLACAILLLSLARVQWVAIPILLFAGMCWMQPLTQFNIAMQTQAPRWVTGRSLAAFQASMAGGLAVGAWIWGQIAEAFGTSEAIALSGLAMLCIVPLGMKLRFASIEGSSGDRDAPLSEPEVNLALTGRSGPIIVEMEYRVDTDRAREFYDLMLEVGRFRRRNGASQWTLARDIAEAECWIERFVCVTWHDYLRQRERMTAGDDILFQRALAITQNTRIDRIRRFLERPTGSVRWRPDSPDPGLQLPFNS